MANENLLQELASTVAQGATVQNVFGPPVQAGNKTILPVARIAYGFGGGFGKGKKPGNGLAASDNAEGGGGGGGLLAKARGVYEISPAGVRFIPADPGRLILIGVLIGVALRSWLQLTGRCRK